MLTDMEIRSIRTQILITDTILEQLDDIVRMVPSGADPRVQKLLGEVMNILETDANNLELKLK